MLRTFEGYVTSVLLLAALALPAAAAETKAAGPGMLKGIFVVGGVDAGLKLIRAGRVKLDEKGTMGYAAILSARPAEGELSQWQTEDPAKKGSFIYVVFEPNGAIWIAELGHATRRPVGSASSWRSRSRASKSRGIASPLTSGRSASRNLARIDSRSI